MMDDFSRRVVKEHGGAGKIEQVVAGSAVDAKIFDRDSRHSTPRTERPPDWSKRIPASGTNRAVSAFEYARLANDARDWEDEVEYGIDHLAPGKRKGLRTV